MEISSEFPEIEFIVNNEQGFFKIYRTLHVDS